MVIKYLEELIKKSFPSSPCSKQKYIEHSRKSHLPRVGVIELTNKNSAKPAKGSM